MNASQEQPNSCISDLRKLVFDEFKLSQEKIDRIGEFLFKIRAWAITANSGLIVGVMSQKLPPLAVLVGFAATFAFWHMERHQRRLRDGYSNRAIALEAALSKLVAVIDTDVSEPAIIASVFRNLQRVPGLAASSRRDFKKSELRNTNEDFLYALQIILLLAVLFCTFFQTQISLGHQGATELTAIGIQRLLEVIRCA